MSQGEKEVGRPAAGNSARRWSTTHRRSIWTGLALAGAGGGGFGAAVLAGVSPGFGQPLATLLGGAGVLAAGTLAYITGQRSRTQADVHHRIDSRHERESALRDRYTAIAAQMADQSAAIRQAGVYALMALADDWHAFGEDDERQVCIDLLQWYLRVPLPDGNDPGKPDLSEREIRQTIAAVLTQRRSRPAADPKSWAPTVIVLDRVSLPECNLSSFDCSGLSLSAADLGSANLASAKLSRTDMRSANLADANLADANLTHANLGATNLSHANLLDANLSHANLWHADLTAAVMMSADLSKASMLSANLADADLTTANLTDVDLAGADLTGANLIDVNLRGANLTDARLGGADLTGSDLTNAKLISANLTGAKLSDTDLSGANLTSADLTDAGLFEVTYNEFTQWPKGFSTRRPHR